MKSSDQCFCPTCGQPVALQKEPPKNGADITAIFEDFWDKYPEIRKTNKYRAQTEWSAARFVLPSNKDILNALDAFVASQEWKKENGKFIPSPHTWIAERRWQDAPIVKKKIKSTISSRLGVNEQEAFEWRCWVYPDSMLVHPTWNTFPFAKWPRSTQQEYLDSITK